MKLKVFAVLMGVISQLLAIGTGLVPASAQINSGDFIVAEHNTHKLVRITPDGVRTEIFSFVAGSVPRSVAIDSNGDFIVSEGDKLSRVTPAGVYTEIFSFAPGTEPHQIAIDSNGDFIVAERHTLSRITLDGARTEIFNFPKEIIPRGVAIDSNGDFIVAETHTFGKLSRITHSGVRTEIFSFPGGAEAWPHPVAIDSNGDFIVPTALTDKLFRVTPGGVGTEIFSFPAGTYPVAVAIDSNGDFIVTGGRGPGGIGTGGWTDKLFRVTPGGVGTIIFSFADGTNPAGVAVMPLIVFEVSIDIKPGSFPNSINPRSRGKIPVAILTTDTFDATTVDPTTVLFGATGIEAAPVQSALEDVDGNGDTDMILHFNTQSTGIVCADTSVLLTAETFDGQMIEGSDSINTVGCK